MATLEDRLEAALAAKEKRLEKGWTKVGLRGHEFYEARCQGAQSVIEMVRAVVANHGGQHAKDS